MKRIFTIIAVLTMTLLMMAQTNQLVWSNGRLIYGTSVETIDSLTYGEMKDIDTLHLLLPRTIIKIVHDTVYIHDTVYVECPENPGETHEYVDLGLSVKWATCNIGAETPEEYGDYFAWAEVETKEKYNWVTYKYCNGKISTLTKYCTKSNCGNNGFTDSKTTLDSEDDVATAIWGGVWRMPTKAEQDELRNNCTWTWTAQNGVNGYEVKGPNGNSIFLPATGYMMVGTLLNAGSNGNYWSSSLYSDNPDYAYSMYFASGSDEVKFLSRCFGMSVRPVCE